MAVKPKTGRLGGLASPVGAKQVNIRELLRRKMMQKELARRGPRGIEAAQIFRLP